MSLDLIIRERTEFKSNNGKPSYLVTTLINFENCRSILEALEQTSGIIFENGCTYVFNGNIFINTLKTLNNSPKTAKSDIEKETLKHFMRSENLTEETDENEDREFEIEACW